MPTENTKDRFDVDDAIVLAAQAHRGKRDKGRPNLPYVTHPLRVMSQFDDPILQMIAVLHDVVEDSPFGPYPVTLDDLVQRGAPDRVVAAVEALTHGDGETNADYWARAAANPDARTVKLADIDDNADENRLALLDPAAAHRLRDKYEKARAALG
jgi:guanosine-3',5'-bis(diphosphate) 3'-pyrophosphohydrolase